MKEFLIALARAARRENVSLSFDEEGVRLKGERARVSFSALIQWDEVDKLSIQQIEKLVSVVGHEKTPGS